MTSKILVVSNDAVWPPLAGGDHRVWSNAKALRSWGDVTIASYAPLRNDTRDVEGISLVSFGLQTGLPVNLRQRASIEPRLWADGIASIETLASNLAPRITVLEGVGLARLASHVRRHTRQLIVDMHNVESILAAQILPWLPAP